MRPLILASTSPYRKAQLESLLLPFECVPAKINEEKEKLLLKDLPPEKIAMSLAQLKAVSLKDDKLVVIGADQLVDFQGQVLGKPGNYDQAFQQLSKMQGRYHLLLTAVCVVAEGKTQLWCSRAKIRMKRLNDQQIKKYLLIDQPYDCAGSYKIEKHGLSIIEDIKTEDFTAIQGLPLIQLSKVLQDLGYEIPYAP